MSESRKSTRREFLTTRAAVRAIENALGGPSELPPPAALLGQAGPQLLSVSREAMACLFEIVFDAAKYRDQTDVAIEALDLVAALENQLTVYRDTSEVTSINRLATQQPVIVEERLFRLFERAVALAKATGSAFDITAGRLSKLWGFYQGRMPTADEIDAVLPGIGYRNIRLCPESLSIELLTSQTELNLGAIGKGYALDQAASALIAGGVDDFLIHGGNSSVLAQGRRFGDSAADHQPPSIADWSIGLRHPLKPDVRLAEFSLSNQALGTSGSGTQFFHHQGKRYGHIIDPRTGWPAEQVLSATVIAPTAEQADALSTAFYVLGIEPAEAFCSERPEISALFVTFGTRASQPEVHPVNLPADRWQRLT
jgi:thiamine biosynthesis lipoprotein